MRRLVLAALLLLPASGCFFVFDDDHRCGGGGDTAWPGPSADPIGLRNPATGLCEYVGGGGGGGGDDCYETQSARAPAYVPDWGTCASACEFLDETSCQAADGCRAVYTDWCTTAGVDCLSRDFAACWPTAPSGPFRNGDCRGLDAYACSLYDDCSPVHEASCVPGAPGCVNTAAGFLACDDERGTPPPVCTALDESACIVRADCTPLYEGSDCSCDPSGCHCNTQTFVSCEAGGGGEGQRCGDITCAGDQYCVHSIGGAPPGVDFYSCEALPAACLDLPTVPTCACLADEPCGWECQQDAATGAFLVTCALP